MSHPIYRFQVGAWSFVSMQDGNTIFEADQFFPQTAASSREAALHECDLPENSLPVSINLLIATSETHCVLVDSGLGRDVGNGEGQILGLLEEARVAPEAINLVVITHGHWDHIGGLTDGSGHLHFPAARHVMPRREWAFWTDEAELQGLPDMYVSWARAHLPPLTERLELIAPDAQLAAGLRARPAPGHTPGHIALIFESGDEGLVHIADALHHPLQLTHPSWPVSVDMDPEQAVATRKEVLEYARHSGMHLFGYHFPFPGVLSPQEVR